MLLLLGPTEVVAEIRAGRTRRKTRGVRTGAVGAGARAVAVLDVVAVRARAPVIRLALVVTRRKLTHPERDLEVLGCLRGARPAGLRSSQVKAASPAVRGG